MAKQRVADAENCYMDENMDGDSHQFGANKIKDSMIVNSTKAKISNYFKSMKRSAKKVCKIRYQVINDDEDRYKCPECGQGFESKNFLKRHEKVHLCEKLIIENWVINAP